MIQNRIGAALLLALTLASCSTTSSLAPQGAAADAVLTLQPGAETRITQTTALRRLTIPAGAHVVAPPGYLLTLTVDGVDVPLAPGDYQGHVVLTPTRDVIVQYQQLEPHHFRSAIYIDNGRYVADKSVAAAVAGGSVTDSAAQDIAITSKEEKFNGILVTGDSTYRIEKPTFNFTGNGGNDFAGFGAAIMSSGRARVTVDKATINTTGAVRTAIFVGGDSDMTVNDSSIEVHNGTLPADYAFTIQVGKMMEVPWMLGLTGNVRATNLVDRATVHYNRSHIRTQGWGALSVDAAEHTRMYVKDSTIETVESGYGAYTIGDSHDYFSHCTFKVADMALIVAANGSATFSDNTVVDSGRFGVVMHSGSGGTLTLDSGTVFNTRSTGIQVKGRGAIIVVDDARIKPANGILLQAMENDDPMAGGGSGPIVGVAGGPPGGAPPGSAGGPPGAGAGVPSDASGPGGAGGSSDVVATFRNTDLQGDIVHTMTKRGDMTITLKKAQLTGAISTGTQAPASGKAPTRATLKSIGDVVNTLTGSADRYGLKVSMDGTSGWTVTRTSYLNSLSLAPGARLSAPKGSSLVLSVDGVEKPLAAGSYRGRIVLQVRPNA
ncbi:MAG: right-handed parallel beta-helix repeat-containing protein [Steroidobacteraceae bacterium]